MPTKITLPESFYQLLSRSDPAAAHFEVSDDAEVERIETSDGVVLWGDPDNGKPKTVMSVKKGDVLTADLRPFIVKPMLMPVEVSAGWNPIWLAPDDGTRFDLLVCGLTSTTRAVAKGMYYGEPLIGARDERVLRGDQNKLSPALQPVGWKIEEKKDV